MTDDPEYDPRYLAGMVLFNERDFFSAHEVWEDLWNNCGDADRRFYQALIQAAVALYHYSQGNLRGAVKLYASSKAYMDRYPSPHLGFDCTEFWQTMAVCFAPVHAATDLLRRDLRPNEALIPTLRLEPPPSAWPNPVDFLEEDDD